MGDLGDGVMVENVDNRMIIQVKGKHIVLSEIKPRIEATLTNSSIEEVRIFASESCSIDADLSHEIWHGRNMVVVAVVIKVCTTVCWDLSGRNSNHTYNSNAGTNENGYGNDGKDGYPGESGGNVLLQATLFEHPERLTIISNGGNGSIGQEGGKGMDGIDGKGITKAEFEKQFPCCIRLFGVDRGKLVKTTIKNMLNLAQKTETQWFKRKNIVGSNEIYQNNILFELNKGGFESRDVYMHVVTHEGCEIIFSLYESIMTDHSFLIYMGSPAQRGKSGGAYGMGGQGGFPGEIVVKNLNNDQTIDIKTRTNWGTDGDNGNGGLYGKHGKNGWDMGYIDWLYGSPILYGQDEKSKLQLTFQSSQTSDSVICSYKQYIGDYAYAVIKESKNDHQSQSAFEERNSTRENTERQYHSKAVGKKSIPRMSILAAFSGYRQQIKAEKQRLIQEQMEEENQQMAQQQNERERQELIKQRINEENQRKAQQQVEEERQRLNQVNNVNQIPQTTISPSVLTEYLGSFDIEQKRQLLLLLTQQIEEENDQLEQQHIEEEKNQLAQQQIKEQIDSLTQQQVEEVNNPLVQQPIEEENGPLAQQQIEVENDTLAQQQIEVENETLAQQLIQETNDTLAQQQIEEEIDEIVEENGRMELQPSMDSDWIMDLHLTRHISFTQATTNQNRYDFATTDSSIEEPGQGGGAYFIFENQLNLDSWLEIKKVIYNRQDIESLADLFFKEKPNVDTRLENNSNEKLQAIEKTLMIKHKFAILNEITKVLPIYHSEVNSFEIDINNIARYLEETEKLDDTISHHMLGTLKQYLFKNSQTQRTNIKKFLAHESNSCDNAITRAVGTFILETASPNNKNEQIDQYYQEFLAYDENKRKKIHDISYALQSKLMESNHEEKHRLWNEYINNNKLPADLIRIIRNDNELSFLYNRLTVEQNAEYNWKRCYADEKIKQIFKHSLEQEGIMSKSYRVLLAYIYDVNIREYARDEDNKFTLVENHNDKSKTVTHILQNGNEFIQLQINENYRKLEEERLHKDRVYRQILTEIDNMQSIQNVEDYFSRKLFLRNGSTSDNEIDSSDETIAIEKIASFFADKERQQIAQRLGNISPKYTGQHGLFENILKRFSFEGIHVSFNELCFLINYIFEHTIEARKEKYTFSWIVAAHNQCNWIDELVLLQLENYFKRQLQEKNQWREYMLKIKNKGVLLVFAAQFGQNPCSSQCVEDILNLLSNVPIKSIYQDQLQLTEWPYVLKERYWVYTLKYILNLNQKSELESESLTYASLLVLSIENTHGNKMMEKLLKLLGRKKDELTHTLLINVLSPFHTQKWNMCDNDLSILEGLNINEWIQFMENKYKVSLDELNASQIVSIIKNNANTSSNIVKLLPAIEKKLADIHFNKIAIDTKEAYSLTASEIKKWSGQFKKTEIKKICYEEMLVVIDRAIELQRGFRLRDTQRLTVLALLTDKNGENKSTLAQVSTGEGKSLIVVATALIKGLLREKVDIITSSSVLAKRDADENKDIYKLFGLSVSHNCSEQIEERKEAYSCNQIIYGDLANFQRDYLLHKFYGKRVLGDRCFENVIVDEVDSMLLDKGNNTLYLSHDIAGMDKLESVYVRIWQKVNIGTDLKEYVVKDIKQTVLDDLYAMIQKEDIQHLDSDLSQFEILMLWERLVSSGIINDSGRLIVDAIDSNQLNEALSPRFQKYKDCLNFLLWSRIEYKTYDKVPNYLKAFVERHLDSWIASAVTAVYMVPGQNYVVDVDRSRTSSDLHANVIILDQDTGTDQISSQWDEALHQFLQLKHGCKLSTQSLKAVFISNVTYLKKYKLLYGLTGTLGSQRERHMLETIHGVHFITVPTAKSKMFKEYEPISCLGKEEWIEKISEEVDKLTKTDKRSVLIICETIKNVEALQMVFDGREQTNVHTYVRDYDKFTVVEGGKKLEPGQIIIATNLAGRGTDIKISDKLENAGGLHVILTYLPVNIRIEEQAFGRAARNGDKGSGRIIMMVAKGKTPIHSNLNTLKQKRNADELCRLSTIKEYYETTIKTEETCFNAFMELYIEKRKILDGCISDQLKEILLLSSLNKWSFWLDENSAQIRKATNEAATREIKTILAQFLTKFKDLKASNVDDWLEWVQEDPMQMIKLGKYIAQHNVKHLSKALQLLESVILSEPYFCEAAYYYRAYARSLDDNNIELFKNDLRMAEQLFDAHIKNKMYASGIVNKLKTSTPQIEGYVEQNMSVINLYSLFIQTIHDMLGHAITPHSFVNNALNEEVAGMIFKDLVQISMIKRAEVSCNITGAQIQRLNIEYGIPVNILKNFLDQHRGAIDEKKILSDIRESFSFPSRIEFWDILVNQNVLNSVEIYVEINEERLEMIDPALMKVIKQKVEIGELVKDVVKLDRYEILLMHEQKSHFYFEKNNLLSMIGEKKYSVLEENELLSFNRKAALDMNRVTSCVFPVFDSITSQDITNKTRITTNEADKIVAELLMQNVLETRGNKLVLTVNFEQQLLFPTYPVYGSAVRDILSLSFAYRIALRNIAQQLEENLEIHINLHPDPYLMFFNDLLQQNIILPPMPMREIDATKIKEIYQKSWSKKTLEKTLAEDIGLSKEYSESLLDVLLKNGWISPLEIDKDSLVLSDKHKQSTTRLVTCIASIASKHDLAESYDVSVAVEKWFNNRLILIKSETATHIANVLKKSRTPLAAFSTPAAALKSIVEFYGNGNFRNIEEMRTFVTNGLEHILQVEEKRWTLGMKINASLVLAAGIAQIAIAAILAIKSAGMSFGVSGILLAEGISNILFAVGAFNSGCFSWKDYGRYKMLSLPLNVYTSGVGTIVGLGYIGSKLYLPILPLHDKRIAERTKNQQLDAVTGSTDFKSIINRAVQYTEKSVLFSKSDIFIDSIVANELKIILKSFASEILIGVMGEVVKHKINYNLQKASSMLGKNGANSLVNKMNEAYMAKERTQNIFLHSIVQIAYSMKRGIEIANAKTGSAGSTRLLLSNITNFMNVVDREAEIGKISNITQQLLDDMNAEVEQQLINQIEHNPPASMEEHADVQSFQMEVIEQWKSTLCKHVGQLVTEKIVQPVTNMGVNVIILHMQKQFNKLRDDMRNLERNNDVLRLMDISEQDINGPNMTDYMKHHLKKQYNKQLLKIMHKPHNHSLLASIIRENVPMDLSCIRACIFLMHKLLHTQNLAIDGLKMIVYGNKGLKQSFSSGVGGHEIYLYLVDNHFTASQEEESGSPNNNSLYGALTLALPNLRSMPQDIFRLELSRCMENDQSIQHHLAMPTSTDSSKYEKYCDSKWRHNFY